MPNSLYKIYLVGWVKLIFNVKRCESLCFRLYAKNVFVWTKNYCMPNLLPNATIHFNVVVFESKLIFICRIDRWLNQPGLKFWLKSDSNRSLINNSDPNWSSKSKLSWTNWFNQIRIQSNHSKFIKKLVEFNQKRFEIRLLNSKCLTFQLILIIFDLLINILVKNWAKSIKNWSKSIGFYSKNFCADWRTPNFSKTSCNLYFLWKIV